MKSVEKAFTFATYALVLLFMLGAVFFMGLALLVTVGVVDVPAAWNR